MRFFQNSAINRIYVHTGLQSFAFNSGSAFVFVYLLKEGMALPLVFLTISAMILARLGFRQALVPLVNRVGLRIGLLLGTIIEALGFLFLANVHSVGPWLIAYVAIAACGTAFYWTCYHACVARLGDEEHRGAQVSAREAIFALTGIVGPIFGGFVLTIFGPFYAFAAAAIFNALAVIPLLAIPSMAILPDAKITRDAKLFGFGMAFSDGLVALAVNFGWRIVLFKTLGENFNAYAGAIAIASLAGAVMGLGVGRLIDLGHHKRSVQIGLAFMVGTILAEAFGYTSVWGAVIANMIGAVAGPLYMSAIMAPLYNVGKASACTFRFNVAAENGFDSGAGFGCLIAAGLAWAGFSSFWLIILGLGGCAGVYLVLRWHGALPVTKAETHAVL
jgi:MFS transporter, DHA1 family, inner membrane transport protein